MNSSIKVFLVCSLLAACGGGQDKADQAESDKPQRDSSSTPAGDGEKAPATTTSTYKTSSRNLVQWKRAAVIEADLSHALELAPDELCKELSDKNCIRDVHLVPLGGNEPYVSGLMKPSVEPLATTPTVIDRVVLSACNTRAQRDATGDARVFTKLALDKKLPAADDSAIKDTVVELYKRFLAREPSSEELQLVSSLAEPEGDQELSAPEFAALACFTIGSSTEFLFF